MKLSIEKTKEISRFLSKNLKEKGVKQSEILELLSKMENYKDWNTFFGVSKKSTTPLWSKDHVIHIDNGGYVFAYDVSNNLLKITTSFFGYSNNVHYFNIKLETLEQIIKAKKETNLQQSFQGVDGDVVWSVNVEEVFIKGSDNSISLSFFAPRATDNYDEKLAKFLDEVKNLANGVI